VAYTFRHGDRPLDGVTIQRAVGRGGFGEVYFAVTDAGKQLAVKFLRDNPEVELRGISQVMNLKSPHLITIYDVRYNEQRDPFVIMEYVSGPSLRDLMLAEPSGFSPQKAAFFLSSICKGLAYLHDRGIVHRDLKPANIFYDDGYVKIGDYGLAKHMSLSQHSAQTVSVGTVHYMAPEVGSGSYTRAIDIYALGVILYEMLTGTLPFSGSSMAEVLMKHLNERVNVSGLPEPFASVVQRCLAKDPKDRFQDANELADAIMNYGDMANRVATFDTSGLTQVLGGNEIGAGDLTRTISPPPLPPVRATRALDARDPAFSQMLDARVQRRAMELNKKLVEKQRSLERKLGATDTPVRPIAFDRLEPHKKKKRNKSKAGPFVVRQGNAFSQLLVCALGAVFGSILVGMVVTEEPTHAIQLGALGSLYLFGGSLGAVAAYFLIVTRLLTPNWLLERVAVASLAALGMAPAFFFSLHQGSPPGAIIGLALVVAIVLTDFPGRIEHGRLRQLSLGRAFWPALIAFIASAVMDNDNLLWFTAFLGAALAVLVQALAAIWPLTFESADPSDEPNGHPAEDFKKFKQGSPAVEPHPIGPVNANIPTLAAGNIPPIPDLGGERSRSADAGQYQMRTPSMHWLGQQQPILIEGEASIASEPWRRALSWLGVALLLLGAGGYAAIDSAHEMGGKVWLNSGPIRVEDVKPKHAMPLLIVGAIMTLMSRRGHGSGHVTRAVFGVALTALAGYLTAQKVDMGNVVDLIQARDFVGSEEQKAIVGAMVVLAIGIMLLVWPRRKMRSSSSTFAPNIVS
jgi:hypothetical protein